MIALAAIALLAVITVFQIALALGAPWGAAAWGGKHPGVLPRKLRLASGIVAVVVYPLLAMIILAAAGKMPIELPFDERIALWVLAGFFALGALANLASRSRVERRWAPVAAGLAICCALLAA